MELLYDTKIEHLSPITKSFRFSGFGTSVRLEARYWDLLEDWAISQGKTLPQITNELYEIYYELYSDEIGFASFLRVNATSRLLQELKYMASHSVDCRVGATSEIRLRA